MRTSSAIQAFLKETVDTLGGPEATTVKEVVEIAKKRRPDLGIDRHMASKFISEKREEESKRQA